MNGIKFSDEDMFGDMTFLDILEDNDIPFVYDGKELLFLHNAPQVMASNIWRSLTGSSILGHWPVKEI